MPLQLYRHDPNYIRPLDKDINEVFDPKKNKAFRHGELIRWLLQNGSGEYIGRIAAFTHDKYTNKGDEQPTGMCGFFECINDQTAANLLFDAAKQWLLAHGKQAMDGPVNFGERSNWWGLLVEGFKPPMYAMNYNPPYYQQLFEQYGFKLFYNQLCFHRFVEGRLNEKFYAGHQRLTEKGGFTAEKVRKNNLAKYAADFAVVYNKAWSLHEGGKEMTTEQALKIFNSMKPVMDEDIAWFAYFKGEPVGMYLNIPELNQIFRHLNGQFNLWSKLKFLWYKWRGECTSYTGIIFGVVPRFHGLGVDYFIITELANTVQSMSRYTETELQWQGDFNPKIINISKALDFTVSRRFVTYRYLFNRDAAFKRHPIL